MRYLTRAWLLAVAVCSACGGAGSSPKDARGDVDESSPAAEGEQANWGAAEPAAEKREPKCYAKCGELIHRAGALYAQAERRKKDASGAFERAGDAYVLAWRGCSLALHGGEDLECEGARDVVPRLVQSYDRAGDDEKMVFAILIAKDRRWSEADAALDSKLSEIAGRLESQAKQSPKDDRVAAGLASAAYARMVLGDGQRAAQDAASFIKLRGKSDPEEAALVAVAMAAHHNDQGEYRQALAVLSAPPGQVPERVTVMWHAERGRAHAGLKQEAEATRSFERALQAWQPLAQDPQLRDKLGPAKPAPMQDRERVVESVGAAHFHAGEVQRARAATVKVPTYRGPKSVAGVATFVNEAIGPFVRERQKVLLEAESAYQKVSEIKPVPPPRYLVASAASIGAMWAQLARDVETSPVPSHLTGDEAEGYRRTLRESMKPVVDKARRAFTICRDSAARMGIDGEHADACAAWLREDPGP